MSVQIRREEADARILRLKRQASEPFEPAPEPPACEIHDWRPERNGGPRPPGSLCPRCKADGDPRKDHPTLEPLKVEHPLNTHNSDKLDYAWRVWLEKQKSDEVAAGSVEPGSIEEQRALDRIEELRWQESERERTSHRGRVVVQRIEHGDLVQYVAPKGRRGLKRVVLQ